MSLSMAAAVNIWIISALITTCGGQFLLQQNLLQQPQYALNTVSQSLAHRAPASQLSYQFLHMVAAYGRKQGVPELSLGLPLLVHNAMQNASSIRLQQKLGYDPDTANQCITDSLRVMESLSHVSLTDYWPISFVDAWGKPPSGAAFGDFTWLGNYQECVRVQAPPDTTRGLPAFKGEYFASTFGYATNHPNEFKVPGVSGLMIGLCMPDSCSVPFVHAVLDAAMEMAGNNTVAVSAVSIQPRPHRPLTPRASGVIALLSVLGACLCAGTVYDVLFYRRKLKKALKRSSEEQRTEAEDTSSDEDDLPILRSTREGPPATNEEILAVVKKRSEEEIGLLGGLLLCFSVPSNTRRLMTVDSGSDSTLHVLHGVRVLSMAWVMLGHTFVFVLLSGTMRNIAIFEELQKRWSMQIIMGGSVCVDSFFVISGVLVSFLTLREMSKKGGARKINWLMFYLHRYWRLTIPYMLILGTTAALFEYVGRGPLWPHTDVFATCDKSWWTNLLYVNNLVLTRKTAQCFSWAWYLANDMQFYWISPLLVVPLFLRRRVGVAVSAAVLLTSLIVTCVISARNHFIPYQGQILKPDESALDEFDKLYQAPWCRIGPYIVGVLLGYVLYVSDRQVKMHRVVVACGWCVAAAVGLLVVFGLYGYSQGHVHLTNSTLAFYNATHRTAWGLAIAWLIFACVTGHGGIVNAVLSWRLLVPLSRLTYMAYLCHPVVMMSYLLQAKYPFNYDDYSIIYLYIGHVVMSYSVAFMLCLGFEAPFMALEKVLIAALQKWWAARRERRYLSLQADSV